MQQKTARTCSGACGTGPPTRYLVAGTVADRSHQSVQWPSAPGTLLLSGSDWQTGTSCSGDSCHSCTGRSRGIGAGMSRIERGSGNASLRRRGGLWLGAPSSLRLMGIGVWGLCQCAIGPFPSAMQGDGRIVFTESFDWRTHSSEGQIQARARMWRPAKAWGIPRRPSRRDHKEHISFVHGLVEALTRKRVQILFGTRFWNQVEGIDYRDQLQTRFVV